MSTPLKVLDLEFTTLEFHQSYVLSKPKAGQIITEKQLEVLLEMGDFYNNKTFVFLSVRDGDLNINPVIYLNLEKKVNNLAGIGIISQNISSLKLAKFEKNFCKLPFEIFMELDAALKWANKILKGKE